ncbi:MAG TPA: flagellar protein FliT [Woeseiaceae bacterium]|nr:flagellar protein FliT [Woeseiaceae bacterium]
MKRALAEIESLTDEMRRCAGQGEWEAVEAALTARDGLVRGLLAGPRAAHHADELRRLLEQDGEILALARKARDAVAAELRQLDNGRKAVHAYGGQNRQSRRTIASSASSADSLDPTEA